MNRKGIIIGGVGAALALIVGVAIGSASKGSTAEAATPVAPVTVSVTQTKTAAPVTKTAPAPAPVTVTETAPPPAPVTETVTETAAAPAAAPAAGGDAATPKGNGDYLVGSQIAPGNWQCADAGSYVSWTTYDAGHEVLDIDLSAIGTIGQSAYSVSFHGCDGEWTKVG